MNLHLNVEKMNCGLFYHWTTHKYINIHIRYLYAEILWFSIRKKSWLYINTCYGEENAGYVCIIWSSNKVSPSYTFGLNDGTYYASAHSSHSSFSKVFISISSWQPFLDSVHCAHGKGYAHIIPCNVVRLAMDDLYFTQIG